MLMGVMLVGLIGCGGGGNSGYIAWRQAATEARVVDAGYLKPGFDGGWIVSGDVDEKSSIGIDISSGGQMGTNTGSQTTAIQTPTGGQTGTINTGGQTTVVTTPVGGQTGTVYVTSSGNKYHAIGCFYLKSIGGSFASGAAAAAAGYTPCSYCGVR